MKPSMRFKHREIKRNGRKLFQCPPDGPLVFTYCQTPIVWDAQLQMEYRKAMWDSTVQDYVREMRNY
jgi:hypothetical protein